MRRWGLRAPANDPEVSGWRARHNFVTMGSLDAILRLTRIFTMTDRSFLGEFEHLVIAAALRLERAYGAQLIREIEEITGRTVQGGSLYITLDRLEGKGYLVSELADPDTQRGGRQRRFVWVTPEGVKALSQHREALLRIWSGLEKRLERV